MRDEGRDLGYWQLHPDNHLALRDAAVAHVWRAQLDPAPGEVHRLMGMLSKDEHARAERFRFDQDRRRFVVARGVLRSLLALYLGLPPQKVQLTYGASGKPCLPRGVLRFNLDAGELGLYAFTSSREVGIDVEHVRQLDDMDQIARRFFSVNEVASLEALPESARPSTAFFNCWTRKEAYVKARGEGLALPLDGFDVSLAPVNRAAAPSRGQSRGRPLVVARARTRPGLRGRVRGRG